MARKDKYNEEIKTTVCESLERGESRKRACELAGISDDTFARYLVKFEDFAVSVKVAEDKFREWKRNELEGDAVRSLKDLIQGKEYTETVTVYENDGSGKPSIKQQTVKKKQVPPNATAIIFALCNAAPERWRQRVEQEVRADIKQETRADDLDKVPKELLQQLVDAMDAEGQ